MDFFFTAFLLFLNIIYENWFLTSSVRDGLPVWAVPVLDQNKWIFHHLCGDLFFILVLSWNSVNPSTHPHRLRGTKHHLAAEEAWVLAPLALPPADHLSPVLLLILPCSQQLLIVQPMLLIMCWLWSWLYLKWFHIYWISWADSYLCILLFEWSRKPEDAAQLWTQPTHININWKINTQKPFWSWQNFLLKLNFKVNQPLYHYTGF